MLLKKFLAGSNQYIPFNLHSLNFQQKIKTEFNCFNKNAVLLSVVQLLLRILFI